ncbi:heme-dependent oxidative N-demethylase family protein [Phyllobacterium sp. 22552]|uniref:heme-dependent oxidative N-demethylase family protein n=1 Tax=Phyllobacterium sp. 22552 TaxID=3453941 RepID=UPI003F8654E5
MNKAPVHTPYDGSSQPFTIGLQQLDLKDWIEVDENLLAYLAEKRRLFGLHAERIFVEEPGTQAAQAEVLELLAAHLIGRYPQLYARNGDEITVSGWPDKIELGSAQTPFLLRAANLVQEDLVLMRKDEKRGWHLAAASLSFPSSWTLLEKFGRSMDDIHAPVPDFNAGTRNADLITRMFDNLRPDRSVYRMNWSLQPGDEMYHPLASHQKGALYTDDDLATHCHIRVERQTLRKLPMSGDILFTIRIYLDPVNALKKHPQCRAVAEAFCRQLEALNPAQSNYKGIMTIRERLIDTLNRL